MDQEKFDEAISNLLMEETLMRNDGSPVVADRLQKIRLQLVSAAQHSVKRTGQVGCGCNKVAKKWFSVCGECGATMPRR